MVNNILRDRREPTPKPVSFAVFAALYSGIRLFFGCFRSLFFAVILPAILSEPEKICGSGKTPRCIFSE
jgi:hypothetical protein